jgi:hypothetical protein
MRALVVVLLVAAPVLAQDAGLNGPTIGTRCSGPDDCKVDLASGTCTTDGGVSSWPAPKEGPACGCVKNVCRDLFIEKVSCRVDADCAIATEPVLHAIPAVPTKKKSKPFRPCKDGERQAVCTDSVCTIRKWKC